MSIRDDFTECGGRGVKGFVAGCGSFSTASSWGCCARCAASTPWPQRSSSRPPTTTRPPTASSSATASSQSRSPGCMPSPVACVWSSGPGRGDGLPRAVPVPFPGAPRHAHRRRLPGTMDVLGGSRSYVDALAERLPAVRSGDPVTSVLRTPDGVEVRTRSGRLETTASCLRCTPTTPSASSPPTAAEKEVRSATRRTRPCCTVTARDAARPPRALVLELPGRHRPGPGRVVTYDEPSRACPPTRNFYVTLNARRHRPGERGRDDAVPAPCSMTRRGAAPTGRDHHADNRVRGRLPGLGLPLGRRGRRGLRAAW